MTDKNTSPEVYSNNIVDLYILSKEFSIMTCYLSNKEYINCLNLEIIKRTIDGSTDKELAERYIAQNLGTYLEKYGNEMYEVNVNSLYNIFFHPERYLMDHEIAYKFIKSEQYKLYFLLESLDSSKLSDKIIKECIKKRQIRGGFMPSIDPKIIYINNNHSYHYSIDDIKQENLKILQTDEKIDKGKLYQMNNNMIQLCQNLALQHEQDHHKLQEDINDIKIKNETFFMQREEELQKQHKIIDELITKNNILKKENLQYQQTIDDLNIKNATLIHQSNEKFDTFCKSVFDLNQKFNKTVNDFEKQIKQYQDINNNLITKNQNLETLLENVHIKYQKEINDLIVKIHIINKWQENSNDYFYKLRKHILKSDIKSVEIPFIFAPIPQDCFMQFKSITEIIIPQSIYSIEAGAFYECSSLKKIHIPFSITKIGDFAFCGCVSLENIMIPFNVTYIGRFAFWACPLIKVTKSLHTENVGGCAFPYEAKITYI